MMGNSRRCEAVQDLGIDADADTDDNNKDVEV